MLFDGRLRSELRQLTCPRESIPLAGLFLSRLTSFKLCAREKAWSQKNSTDFSVTENVGDFERGNSEFVINSIGWKSVNFRPRRPSGCPWISSSILWFHAQVLYLLTDLPSQITPCSSSVQHPSSDLVADFHSSTRVFSTAQNTSSNIHYISYSKRRHR